MAQLILTDEEKAALTWFELDDATIGKIVKKTALGLIDHSKEMERVWWFSAALLLCGQAVDHNANSMTVDIEGFEHQGGNFGDWRVRVERIHAGGPDAQGGEDGTAD